MAKTEAEVYLFTGPENGNKSDSVFALRALAEKKYGAVDFYKYYASEARIADVLAQLQNESLFSAALFVVLENAELIKQKADIDMLVAYIKGASASANTLVIESDENSVDKKLEAAVPASHKKIFWEMFENQKPQWVRRYFDQNGFSVTEDAVEQILDMVENDTASLRTECSRFFYCFEKGHRVTVEDVDKILSHNREENAFSLFEALADGDRSPWERLEGSLAILQKIRLSRDSSSVAVIAGLTYCFRQLRTYHLLYADGRSPAESQLRAAGFSSKTAQNRYRKAARLWGAGTVSSILALLSATDMAIRESGSAQEDARLALLVYAITVKNGLFPAAYEAF